jgi:hypothetical protein
MLGMPKPSPFIDGGRRKRTTESFAIKASRVSENGTMTIKTAAILVDRLENSLAAQGVKLKRRALLEASASAFGFRNSNAFTAASAAGDIAPPPVGVIGRVDLPSGESIIVVQDPLAGAPYAIDASFIEQEVDEQRREQIGVTPYGHLVDLREVSAAQAGVDHCFAVSAAATASSEDNGLITISRDDLSRLLHAAQSHHEEISSGIEEGIYEADQNPDLDDLYKAIDTIEARLELPLLPPRKKADAPAAGKLPVYIARVVHKHGSDIYAALSEADRDRQLSEYCQENWHEIADESGIPANPAGMSDHEICSLYFEVLAEDEREWVEEEIIQIALPEGLVVPTPPAAKMAYEDLASILENGSAADVWYDAHEFGSDDEDDADRIAERNIDTIKQAMVEAAEILRTLPDLADQLPSRERRTTCFRCDSPLRANGLCSDETCGFSGHSQNDEAGWDGHPDAASIIAANRLARRLVEITDTEGYGRDANVSLTERETEFALHGVTINSHLDQPFALGSTLFRDGKKWLAALTDFTWDLGEADGEQRYLSSAVAYMQEINDLIGNFGGWCDLNPCATEFSHELTVYMPMDLALESQAAEDWQAALSYLLMTASEKAQRPQVTCEFTAEVDANGLVIAVDPLGDTTWDGTFDALRWGADAALGILTGGGDADDYAFSPLAPKWVGEWSSARPFTVEPIGLQRALNIIL